MRTGTGTGTNIVYSACQDNMINERNARASVWLSNWLFRIYLKLIMRVINESLYSKREWGWNLLWILYISNTSSIYATRLLFCIYLLNRYNCISMKLKSKQTLGLLFAIILNWTEVRTIDSLPRDINQVTRVYGIHMFDSLDWIGLELKLWVGLGFA